jgi:hypothetical protein
MSDTSISLNRKKYTYIQIGPAQEFKDGVHRPSSKCPCRPFLEKEAGLVIHRRIVTAASENGR